MKMAAIFTVTVFFIVQSSAESSGDAYPSHIYNPAHVNFNEIFTNSLAMLNDDTLTTAFKEDDFHLNNLPSQFAEFRQTSYTTPTLTTTTSTTPTPKFLKPSYLEKDITTLPATEQTVKTETTSTSTTTTTNKPKVRTPTHVLPLRNHQRGVLDLIFPASRVKEFKNVFDSFRRILSHTFRK